MRISIIRRLSTTYAFWRALGAKDCNTALAVVHEGGFASITSGNLSLDAVKTMRTEAERTVAESAGYDYEHKTTRPD